MTKNNKKNPSKEVFDFGSTAFLAGAAAIVKMSDSSDIVTDKKLTPITITPKRGCSKEISFVPRGRNNNMPYEILEKIEKNVTVASNIDFKSKIIYGEGVMVVRKVKENGKITIEELVYDDYPDIFDFIENNNYNFIIRELANDLTIFSDAYSELIFNQESTPQLVQIKSKETCCSRISLIDEKTFKSEWHGYSAKWHEGKPDDVVATPLLDKQSPIYDLKVRLGLIPNLDGKNEITKDRRFVLATGLTTPGRFYYNKSYWWSIFLSGWYDFACAIPSFKKALIKNQMVLKYEILISRDFWNKLYASENITDDEKKQARKAKFLKDMNDFLSGEENAGKSFVSHFEYDKLKNYEIRDIIIKPIESFFKGGEYIEDSEEVSNMLCYGMGVHPSIIGAAPGKAKSINGTEARELFIIHQAMVKPIQDEVLLPLYIGKAVNNWDKNIFFVIPNMQLTTLDKGTGAEKNMGLQKQTEQQ